MTGMVLKLFLLYHIALLPLFYPSVSGIHNAQETVSDAPRWHHILHTNQLEQPNGVILIWRTKW